MDKENLDKLLDVEEIDVETINNMNFYDTALYIQTLNQMEEMYKDIAGEPGENNE